MQDTLNVSAQTPSVPIFEYWLNYRKTSVSAEIVALAAERTGSLVEFQEGPGEYHQMDMCDAAEAWDNGYNPDRLRADHGSLWSADHTDKAAFWRELERLEKVVKSPLDEPILDDNGRMYGGYMYVIDGKPTECQHFNGDDNRGISVTDYKRRYRATEVKRCDIAGRIARLPEDQKRSDWERKFHTQMGDDVNFHTSMTSFREGLVGTPNHWDKAGRTIRQMRRRPRCSNKIKKVQ